MSVSSALIKLESNKAQSKVILIFFYRYNLFAHYKEPFSVIIQEPIINYIVNHNITLDRRKRQLSILDLIKKNNEKVLISQDKLPDKYVAMTKILFENCALKKKNV